MGFTRMDFYSENNLPSCGSATSSTLCKNIDNYIPYDISGVVGCISPYYDNTSDKVTELNDSIKELVVSLDDAWGKKFISFNDNGLDFVVPDNFYESLNSINDSSNEQVERCKKIISDISSRLEDVKSYVERLQDNLKEYNKLCSRKSTVSSDLNSYMSQLISEKKKDNPSSSTISNLSSNISDCNTELYSLNPKISVYEASIINEPDGQWIVV